MDGGESVWGFSPVCREGRGNHEAVYLGVGGHRREEPGWTESVLHLGEARPRGAVLRSGDVRLKGVDKEENIVGWGSRNSYSGPRPEIQGLCHSDALFLGNGIPPALPHCSTSPFSLPLFHILILLLAPHMCSYQSAPFWPGCLVGVAPCTGPLP